MSNNKTQLDVYRIDKAIILNELKDFISLVEYKKLQELVDCLDESGEISEDDLLYISQKFIDYIIRQQNGKKNALKYKQITLEPSQCRSYRLFLFEAYKESVSSVKMLVGDQVKGRTQKNMNVSYILFLINGSNMFAFCSGSGWQSVTPYADTLFGLNILARLVYANTSCINTVNYRGFTGAIATQKTSFRKNARTSEIIDFGQLCKDLSGRIGVEKVREALGVEPALKRKNIGADFKSSFKLKKRMDLLEFCNLLDKITDLLKLDPYFSIEDFLGILALGNSAKEKKIKKDLFDAVLDQFYINAIKGAIDDESVFISDNNISDYMSAGVYRLSSGKNTISVDEFSCGSHLEDYVKFLIEKYNGNPTEMPSSIVAGLRETVIESFAENEGESPLTKGKLIDSIQLDLVHKKRNYILIEGKWYEVYEGFTNQLNTKLPAIIKDRLSAIKLPQWKDIDEDKYIDLLALHHQHAKLHKKRPLNNIELCDTILFSGDRLILFHMKDGFDTTMRVLTAQVQSSAELLTDIILTNRSEELKGKWENLDRIDNLPSWNIIEQALLGKYKIVECLVMNPGIDISKDVSLINSTIAKYELSRLIKKWSYDFDLEIILPGVNTDQ